MGIIFGKTEIRKSFEEKMYARVNYTCTKNVNSRLWNPGYSLNKVIGTVAQSISQGSERNPAITPLTKNEATAFSTFVDRRLVDQATITLIEQKPSESKAAKVSEKPRPTYAQITKSS